MATERQCEPAFARNGDQRHAPEKQLRSLCILHSEKPQTPLHHVFDSRGITSEGCQADNSSKTQITHVRWSGAPNPSAAETLAVLTHAVYRRVSPLSLRFCGANTCCLHSPISLPTVSNPYFFNEIIFMLLKVSGLGRPVYLALVYCSCSS